MVQVSTQFQVNPLWYLAKDICSDCGIIGSGDERSWWDDGNPPSWNLTYFTFLGWVKNWVQRQTFIQYLIISGTVTETEKIKVIKLLDLWDSFFTISCLAYMYWPMSFDFLSLTSNIFIVRWSVGDSLTYVKS